MRNEVGNRYGKLVVVEEAEPLITGSEKKIKSRRVKCQCDCGNTKTVLLLNMKQGRTTSCGCVKASRVSHGMSDTKEYGVWVGIKYRCNNPSSPDYYKYGGRGIKVCDRWSDPLYGFINFLSDMGERPKDGGDWTIERIDVNKGYEPSNCKWLLREEQLDNRRNVYKWNIDGEVVSLKQLIKKTGIDNLKTTFYGRMSKVGYDREKGVEIIKQLLTENGIYFSNLILA